MATPLNKVIRRFWPGVLALGSTLVLLALILEPRPRGVVELSVPTEINTKTGQRTNLGEVIRSADNRYAAMVYSTSDQTGSGTGSLLILRDMAGEELFRATGEFNGICFEASGSLVFQTRPYKNYGPVDIKEQ